MTKNKAKLIIFTGPSGVGKGTMLADFFKRVDNKIVYSVSCTTRAPRDGEINGMHYFFISKEEFEQMIKEEQFLESACYSGNYYGTNKKFVDEKTLIFFIRTKENPETPLVTVEYSIKEKKVLQCYGDHDTKPSEEILSFVHHKWLPYAKRQMKKIAA